MPLPRLIIMGVAESDAHAVANQLIAFHLRQCGFMVVNLGVCTPVADFAAAVRENQGAEAVLIESLNGHILEDLRELPAYLAAGEFGCPIIVGGNLSVGSVKDASVTDRLYALGVDYVVTEVEELNALLKIFNCGGYRRV